MIDLSDYNDNQIPDYWEYLYGLSSDNSDDTDQGGATNLQEFQNGTFPKNTPDSDNDGMPDGWEIDNGLNPQLDDAGSNNDDRNNLQEYNDGTDPNTHDEVDQNQPPLLMRKRLASIKTARAVLSS